MRTLAAALVLALAMPALAQQAAPAAAIPSAAAAPERAPAYGKTEGVIPGMLIGPKLSLVSVPHPAIGLEAKLLQNRLGLSFDYDLWPDIKVMDVEVGYTDWNLGAKWYPWQASFFVGAVLGNRSFHASAKEVSTGFEVKAEVKTTYLAPEIGWRFVWPAGFFMGIDLGYQLVLSNDVTLRAGSVSTDNATQDVQDAADDLGKVGFPVITLLQAGWFF